MKFAYRLQLRDSNKLKTTLDLLAPYPHHAVSSSIEKRTYGWLSVLPLFHHRFDPSSVKFWVALALRYHRSFLRVPSARDGCGASFSLFHEALLHYNANQTEFGFGLSLSGSIQINPDHVASPLTFSCSKQIDFATFFIDIGM